MVTHDFLVFLVVPLFLYYFLRAVKGGWNVYILCWVRLSSPGSDTREATPHGGDDQRNIQADPSERMNSTTAIEGPQV